MIDVTVYTKPGCVQCEYTIRLLTEQGVQHQCFDISEHKHVAQELRDIGSLQMPYVVAGEDSWQGLKVDKIKALAKALKAGPSDARVA